MIHSPEASQSSEGRIADANAAIESQRHRPSASTRFDAGQILIDSRDTRYD